MTFQVLMRLVSAMLLVGVLIVHVPPSTTSLLAIAIVVALLQIIDVPKTALLAVSLTILTLALEAASRLGAGSVTPFYRPHEMLALEQSYQPNQSVDMQVPHGDLLVIDSGLPRTLAQPRRELFVTDSNGYRNAADYQGQALVLVGDSFLVGTDTTLAERLTVVHRQPTYNVSFAGSGPLLYAEKIAWARDKMADACVVAFFFEGNDFQVTQAADVRARSMVPAVVQDAVRGTVGFLRRRSQWSKVFYGLVTRSASTFRQAGTTGTPPPEITFVRSVGARPMAFLKGYADVTRRPSFDDFGFVAGRLAAARPDLVVFVPDKYRVYAPLLDEMPESSLPHAQWAYLERAARAAGVEAVDLTTAMIEHSRASLSLGETTYWRDDTHWNRLGEDVAADSLLRALSTSALARCRDAVASR